MPIPAGRPALPGNAADPDLTQGFLLGQTV